MSTDPLGLHFPWQQNATHNPNEGPFELSVSPPQSQRELVELESHNPFATHIPKPLSTGYYYQEDCYTTRAPFFGPGPCGPSPVEQVMSSNMTERTPHLRQFRPSPIERSRRRKEGGSFSDVSIPEEYRIQQAPRQSSSDGLIVDDGRMRQRGRNSHNTRSSDTLKHRSVPYHHFAELSTQIPSKEKQPISLSEDLSSPSEEKDFVMPTTFSGPTTNINSFRPEDPRLPQHPYRVALDWHHGTEISSNSLPMETLPSRDNSVARPPRSQQMLEQSPLVPLAHSALPYLPQPPPNVTPTILLSPSRPSSTSQPSPPVPLLTPTEPWQQPAEVSPSYPTSSPLDAGLTFSSNFHVHSEDLPHAHYDSQSIGKNLTDSSSRPTREPEQKALATESESYDNFYTPSNETFYKARPYTRLDRRRREIRLLRVFPKKPAFHHYKDNPQWNIDHIKNLEANQSILACRMENTALTRVDGNYSTLSYCAGDPKNTAVILVNGIPFNAFANLEHAIESVLSSKSPDQKSILLWADQICINQSDKEERAQQVQIMRDIYIRSEKTFVCLSTPQIRDCLSWVRPMEDGTTASSFVSRRKDAPAVVRLKNFLLDCLVGVGQGGELRPLKSFTAFEVTAGMEKLQQLKFQPITRRIAPAQSPPTVSDTLWSSGSANASPTGLAQGHVPEQNLRSSFASFQNSVAAFMTNVWWRR
jgi:hypothetical protein